MTTDVSGGDPGAALPGVVALDTDVASWLLVKPGPQHGAWKQALLGRSLALPTQVRAELLGWPLTNGWGAERTARLEAALASLPTIPVDGEVVRHYAELSAWGRSNGHPIGAKEHAADRWVAATARAFQIELASMDHIFDEVDGVALLPRPEVPAGS